MPAHAFLNNGTPSPPPQAMFVHLPDVAVMGLDDMAVMVRFVAQRIMLGTVGLLPDACSHR